MLLERQDQPADAQCSGTRLAQQPRAHPYFSCPKSTMNANTDAPWWRHWSIWVALVRAALAIFLPVVR